MCAKITLRLVLNESEQLATCSGLFLHLHSSVVFVIGYNICMLFYLFLIFLTFFKKKLDFIHGASISVAPKGYCLHFTIISIYIIISI